MKMPMPAMPPYDVREWQKKPFAERMTMVCQAWALQGYGTPWPIYLVYLLKIGLYVGGFCFFCSMSAGPFGPSTIASWWASPEAFQKALLWSVAFEGLGLGCGSGPLTGRYFPPMGGALYFLRPGTTKLPLFPGIPVFGGDRRTWLDVGLYAVHYALLARSLCAPAVTPWLLAPTIALLPLLGLTDKTLFLVARGEHYYTALVCFLFAGQGVAGSKVVWAAIWLWAATSKLNPHFPSVISVMQSNSPLTNVGGLRKLLFRSYPDDLRASRLAEFMARAGMVVEYAFPITLLLSSGGPATQAALAAMVCFHVFITSSVPMGVPIEWNVMMVYGGFALFGAHAGVSVLDVRSPVLLGVLALGLLVVPIVGNFVPKAASFLCSMRYYAGNWAYSIWLFKGQSARKLDRGLVKAAPLVVDQLTRFYGEEVTVAVLAKVMAFRALHLQGRALEILLPKAVDDLEAYEYHDGEVVAGIVLGWNFGDGHLHDMQLLRAVQRQCGFEEGELRCVFVESQPMGGSTLAFTIADAATGTRETGELDVRELLARRPWPSPSPAAAQAG